MGLNQIHKRFDCLFLRLSVYFCVWLFVFAFDSTFLRLILSFCV